MSAKADKTELCACGLPLHYSDPTSEYMVRRMIATLGPEAKVTVAGLGTWLVPRHFIALHGFKGSELPVLAGQYGFKRVQ